MTHDQTGTSPFPSAPRFACIGEAMIELSSVDFLEGSASVGVAGDTYNTAVYLARSLPGDARVEYVTALGHDRLSDAMVDTFRREGLGTDLIARHPTRTAGIYSIQVDRDGERTFSYWRSASAARAMFGEIGPDLTSLGQFDAVYLSGITLAILPDPVRRRLIDACAQLGRNGMQVIFDSNYRSQLWISETEARSTMEAMWRAATIALPSEDDELALYPGLSPEDLANRIAALGPAEVILKRAAAGPLVLSGGQTTQTAFPPAERVVDTTAAGDSFNAGYLAARAKGADPLSAARAGHDLATHVIGVKGAIAPSGPPGDPARG
ncbi:MAG: sugar kinase [Pseudooceanicola sp.]